MLAPVRRRSGPSVSQGSGNLRGQSEDMSVMSRRERRYRQDKSLYFVFLTSIGTSLPNRPDEIIEITVPEFVMNPLGDAIKCMRNTSCATTSSSILQRRIVHATVAVCTTTRVSTTAVRAVSLVCPYTPTR